MELEIGGLDAVDPVEGNVEHAVQDEPDDVQRQEVEVQANHALKTRNLIQWSYRVHEDFHFLPFPPPILVNLRVERDGPSNEIDPSNNVAKDVQGLVIGDGYQDEGILSAEDVYE